MNLRFFETHSRVIRVVKLIHEIYKVVKVERSASGFKTSTGTNWTCRECREGIQGSGSSGVETFPMAVWKLTGKLADRSAGWGRESTDKPLDLSASLKLSFRYLCSDHFKQLREEWGNAIPVGKILTDVFSRAEGVEIVEGAVEGAGVSGRRYVRDVGLDWTDVHFDPL